MWEEMDRNGITLWNTCTKLKRGFEGEEASAPLLLLNSRVLAYLLLDCAAENRIREPGSLPRIFKISLKVAKSCLEAKNVDLAHRVLEKVCVYEEKLQKNKIDIEQEDTTISQPLLAGYYVLRTALAWQQNNFKLAEHMFNKCLEPDRQIDPQTAESLSDVLYEIGHHQLMKQKEYKEATRWLDRAFDVLNSQEPDRLSNDANELRISICQARIKSRLLMNDTGQQEEAKILLQDLENDIGGKLVVWLLKLELISANPNEHFEAGSYSDIVLKMISSLSMIEGNFKLIMFHIRKLHERHSHLGCQALDDFLKLRVLPESSPQWIERAIVTRVYMTDGDTEDALEALKHTMELVVERNVRLGASASLGVHTLLWKKIESCYARSNYLMSENWCRLALLHVFSESGSMNIARISRKLLLCALSQNEYVKAGDVFASMPDASKTDKISQFLMYKVAIRSGDAPLASQALQTIAKYSADDPGLLYACCLDASSVADSHQLLRALLCVLEEHGIAAHPSINLPTLIRTASKIIISLLEASNWPKSPSDDTASVTKLCALFEIATESMTKALTISKSGETQWTIQELDWFSKNSYNLAIAHVCDWDPQSTLKMILCCIKFIEHYPLDIGQQITDDLKLRKLFCEFTGSAALLALARGEEKIEIRLQNYLELRKHVKSFDKLLEERLTLLEDISAKDLLQKLAILITFDFEAACHLKAWDSLGEVILRAAICQSMKVYQLMADCLLCSQAPVAITIAMMKKIINAAWTLKELDFMRLAKYMRCLFQLALSNKSMVAEELIDQIQEHAEQAKETGQTYPREELEWIVTSAFNYGIDLYCTEDDDGARRWLHKAINLASHIEDQGELERLLQDRLLVLKFNSQT